MMIKGVVARLERPFCRLASFATCNRGATAIEYGLIVAGIAVGVSVAVLFFGTTLRGYFNYFAAYLSNPG